MTAPVFEKYATWYDAFNASKDYSAEVKFLLEKIHTWKTPKTWLDIGCGTGKHLALLASRGIEVEGVDESRWMIDEARLRYPRILFHVGTAAGIRLTGNRDVVSMLFHVVSYQKADIAVSNAIRNATAHLARDGILVFDFWHTPAVLRTPPGERIREIRIDDRTLFRISRPTEDRSRSIVDVRFEFRWDSPTGPLMHEETHGMRHFRAEELSRFLIHSGLDVLAVEGWLSGRALCELDWYGLICARRS